MSCGIVSHLNDLGKLTLSVGTVRNIANGGTASRAPPAHLPPSMSGRQLPQQPHGPRGLPPSASSTTMASVNSNRPLPRAPGSSTGPEYPTLRVAASEVPRQQKDATPTKANTQPWRDNVEDFDFGHDDDGERRSPSPADDEEEAMLDGVIIPAIESVGFQMFCFRLADVV